MFSYKPLLHQLIEKNITKAQLGIAANISAPTLAKISKNEPISMTTLDNICTYLNCNIEDVIVHVKN